MRLSYAATNSTAGGGFDFLPLYYNRMRAWVGALDKKRVGCKRMVLGSFKRGKLLSIVAAEVVWST